MDGLLFGIRFITIFSLFLPLLKIWEGKVNRKDTYTAQCGAN